MGWLIFGGLVILAFLGGRDDSDSPASRRIRDKSNDDLTRTRHYDNQRIDAENKARGKSYREDV